METNYLPEKDFLTLEACRLQALSSGITELIFTEEDVMNSAAAVTSSEWSLRHPVPHSRSACWHLYFSPLVSNMGDWNGATMRWDLLENTVHAPTYSRGERYVVFRIECKEES